MPTGRIGRDNRTIGRANCQNRADFGQEGDPFFDSYDCRKLQATACSLHVSSQDHVFGDSTRTMRYLASRHHLRRFRRPLRCQWHAACSQTRATGASGSCTRPLRANKERQIMLTLAIRSQFCGAIRRAQTVDIRGLARGSCVPRTVVGTRLRRNVPLFPWLGPRPDADCRRPWPLVVSQKPDSIRRGRGRFRRRQRPCRYGGFAVALRRSCLLEKRPFGGAALGRPSGSTARRVRQILSFGLLVLFGKESAMEPLILLAVFLAAIATTCGFLHVYHRA